MRVLYEVCDKAEDELRQICKKTELTKDDLDNMYKLIDIVKDVKTVEAMKNAEEQGWSRDYPREYSRGYEEDYSNTYPIYKMARDGEREPGYSYRRGCDSMGRYTSRDNDKEGMIGHLREMMMNARTEDERENYRKTIDNLSRN